MKKYKCKIIYVGANQVNAVDATFKKLSIEDFDLNGEKLAKKLKGSKLDKVISITQILARSGANIISTIAGEAPHEELASFSGFWKVEGKNILPNSYFPTTSQDDITDKDRKKF